MSAPQQTLLAGFSATKYTTTMTRAAGSATGPPAVGFTGFGNAAGPTWTPDSLPYGSLSSPTFFKALTCKNYYTEDFTTKFVVSLSGNQPQATLFKAVNSTGTYFGAAAAYNFDGTNSHWAWNRLGGFAASGTETIELWG